MKVLIRSRQEFQKLAIAEKLIENFTGCKTETTFGNVRTEATRSVCKEAARLAGVAADDYWCTPDKDLWNAQAARLRFLATGSEAIRLAYLTLADYCETCASGERGGPTEELVKLAEAVVGLGSIDEAVESEMDAA